MKVITLAMLERRGACEWQRNMFVRTFGKRAAVTEENVRKAVDNWLQVEWILRWDRRGPGKLAEQYWRRYNRAWAMYDRACERASTSMGVFDPEAVKRADNNIKKARVRLLTEFLLKVDTRSSR